jgi:pimeloyl-ACP methyl ester carboxylesterase
MGWPSTGGRTVPRDVSGLTLRTADGVTLAADVWHPRVPPASAVVLVHGFTAHRRDPSVVAMAHDLRDAGHAVVCYDMRGHGESEGLCTLGDREALDVAAAVLAARDLAPRVVLVGASLGAIAVLRHAADDPDLAGVVTVSSPAQWKVASPRAAFAAVLTRTRVGRRLARRLGARLDTTWRWTEPPDRLAARLRVPYAVVHGTGDRFMPASEAELLHAAGGDTADTADVAAAAPPDGGGTAGSVATVGADAAGYVATVGAVARRLDLVPGMGHAFCMRGLDTITDAVAWCLAQAPDLVGT